jgi:hypothetical protein
MMASVFAYAQMNDSSGSDLVLILVCAVALGVLCILGAIPIWIARSRRLRYVDFLTVGTVLWGLLSATTVVSLCIAQLNWSKERSVRLESGYAGSDLDQGAPAWPWGLWTMLAATYGVLVLISIVRKKRNDAAPSSAFPPQF